MKPIDNIDNTANLMNFYYTIVHAPWHMVEIKGSVAFK